MKVSYDPEADAVFVRFNRRRSEYVEEIDDRRNLLCAADDSVIGIELLSVSRGVDLRGLPHAIAIADALKRERIKVLA
jgi:uncharacterized protein YuzE